MDAAMKLPREWADGLGSAGARRLALTLLGAFWLAVALRPGVAVAEPAVSEYRLKAVFLFNFSQFIEWPPSAFPTSNTPFVIGVLGKDPFGAQLDEVVRGERVAAHPLVVERYASAAQIQRCNILFIAGGDARLQSVPGEMKGRSILTVTDADEKDLPGIMVRLVTQERRVRLRIDVVAARADELTISSKLLRPAEIVGSRTEGRR